jgi:hypothetical protein
MEWQLPSIQRDIADVYNEAEDESLDHPFEV